mmetsp:Transcript_45004/g.126779  ORF Transcript_45004/g.126779 Transcript_45004/m.126779 type:complete len:247 (+) Transcript_45004:706-1446(+)
MAMWRKSSAARARRQRSSKWKRATPASMPGTMSWRPHETFMLPGDRTSTLHGSACDKAVSAQPPSKKTCFGAASPPERASEPPRASASERNIMALKSVPVTGATMNLPLKCSTSAGTYLSRCRPSLYKSSGGRFVVQTTSTCRAASKRNTSAKIAASATLVMANSSRQMASVSWATMSTSLASTCFLGVLEPPWEVACGPPRECKFSCNQTENSWKCCRRTRQPLSPKRQKRSMSVLFPLPTEPCR